MTLAETIGPRNASRFVGHSPSEDAISLPGRTSYRETFCRENAKRCITDSTRLNNNTAISIPSNSVGSLNGAREFKTGQGEEAARGRSLQRTFRIQNPLERAQSRLSREQPTIEVNVKPIEIRKRRRSTFLSAFIENSTDPRAIYEDDLLEPCPNDSVCRTVSDIIEQPLLFAQRISILNNSEVSASRGCNVRQTMSSQESPNKASVELGALLAAPAILPETLLQMIPALSYIDYETLRSAIPLCTPAAPPASTRVPQEILHQIYDFLNPTDFNSARHTCRAWYISSLRRSTLQTMLKRAGWSNSIPSKRSFNHLGNLRIMNDVWLMSKRIARECALGSGWTGNGLSPAESDLGQQRQCQPTRATPFIHTSTTDFAESRVQYPFADGDTSEITFSISTCGRFLMVAQGCLVYIYELNQNENCDIGDKGRQSGALRPISRLICPRRVLACSMDTSSQRYAIAVLMDGRMGLVCDLTSLSKRPRHQFPPRLQSTQLSTLCVASTYRAGDYRGRTSTIFSRHCYPYQAPTGRIPKFTFPVIAAAEPSSDSKPSREFQQRAQQDMRQTDIPRSLLWGTNCSRSQAAALIFAKEKKKAKSTSVNQMPTEQCVPTMYAQLCSTDDPPRSVALCPKRRCVAFGCSSGIELHWVDALTGQDLNRWFPLTVPSDYLFFLPPRAGVDSAKKLRLISSASRPTERSVTAEKYNTAMYSSIEGDFISATFCGSLSGRYSGPWLSLGAGDGEALRAHNSDHYRAIPLSDGYHILFTDPTTDLLCLGSDAPTGGPTKLLRKFWFAGPPGAGSPIHYAGANDLRKGVRVVAAYRTKNDESIWLFSIPGDVFTDSMAEHGSDSLNLEKNNGEWVKWWNNARAQDWLDPTRENRGGGFILEKDRVWPLQVRGQEIGKCRGLTVVYIDSGPEMTIWAFSKYGVAQTWRIDDGNRDGTMKKRFTVRDGTVKEGDRDGDVEMCESPESMAESPVPSSSPGNFYDGTASLPPYRYSTRSRNSKLPYRTGLIDNDGDTIMTEADHAYESDESSETVALAHDRHEITYHNNGHAGRCYIEKNGFDGVRSLDESGGISRLDIDIR